MENTSKSLNPGWKGFKIVLLTDVDASPGIHVLHALEETEAVILKVVTIGHGALAGVQGVSEVIQNEFGTEGGVEIIVT